MIFTAGLFERKVAMVDFNKLPNWGTLLLTLFLLTTAAFTKESGRQLITLHEAVGTLIDSQENERFHLFSPDAGLISARVYSTAAADLWHLHLLGEKDGHSWILIRELNWLEKQKLVTRILLVQSGNQPVSEPAIKIDLPEQIKTEHPLHLKLRDDTHLYGRIRFCSADTVFFATLSGVNIDIPENQILEARWPKGKIMNGSFARYDPANYRLFFGPTGRTLQKGEVNFSDFSVFFPSVAGGVADAFMLGGGISILPGASSQLFYIAPKLRFLHRENLDWSIGLLYTGIPEEGSSTVAYTALSTGSPLSGITLGAAAPIFTNDNDLDVFAFLFGAETQVSNRLKLITENWWFVGGEGEESFLLLSGGFRFMGERLAVDLAFATSPEFFGEGVDFPFIPYVAFSVNFGR